MWTLACSSDSGEIWSGGASNQWQTRVTQQAELLQIWLFPSGCLHYSKNVACKRLQTPGSGDWHHRNIHNVNTWRPSGLRARPTCLLRVHACVATWLCHYHHVINIINLTWTQQHQNGGSSSSADWRGWRWTPGQSAASTAAHIPTSEPAHFFKQYVLTHRGKFRSRRPVKADYYHLELHFFSKCNLFVLNLYFNLTADSFTVHMLLTSIQSIFFFNLTCYCVLKTPTATKPCLQGGERWNKPTGSQWRDPVSSAL